MKPLPNPSPSCLSALVPSCLILLILLLCGCANYDFHVLQPADVALHVTPDQDAQFKVDPLQYHLMDYDNRLVMEITNPTPGTIELLPNKSTVIDADSLSHPLRGQLLTPNSTVRLVFPPTKSAPINTPPPPTPAPGTFGSPTDQPGQLSGPAVGLGGEAYNPNDTSNHDEESHYDWNWDGEGTIKLHLIFKQDNKTFEQAFVLSKTKR